MAITTHADTLPRATILIVDDEVSIRTSTSRLLNRMGVECMAAGNGEEALAMFEAHRTTIDVVILDMGMPVMGGARCFERLRELDPNVRVLIITGDADDVEARRLVAAGAQLLEKPFASTALRAAISGLLGAGLAAA